MHLVMVSSVRRINMNAHWKRTKCNALWKYLERETSIENLFRIKNKRENSNNTTNGNICIEPRHCHQNERVLYISAYKKRKKKKKRFACQNCACSCCFSRRRSSTKLSHSLFFSFFLSLIQFHTAALKFV